DLPEVLRRSRQSRFVTRSLEVSAKAPQGPFRPAQASPDLVQDGEVQSRRSASRRVTQAAVDPQGRDVVPARLVVAAAAARDDAEVDEFAGLAEAIADLPSDLERRLEVFLRTIELIREELEKAAHIEHADAELPV